MPRGGRRPGAGRKPKSALMRAIDGNAGHRPAKVLPHTSAPAGTEVEPVDEFDAPDTLGAEARKVWLLQAPYAFKARTLTRATALSFERYCRMVVLEGEMAVDGERAGSSDHRGLLQRINALELQFLLTPCGKAILEAAPPAAKPQNPLDRFLKKKA